MPRAAKRAMMTVITLLKAVCEKCSRKHMPCFVCNGCAAISEETPVLGSFHYNALSGMNGKC